MSPPPLPHNRKASANVRSPCPSATTNGTFLRTPTPTPPVPPPAPQIAHPAKPIRPPSETPQTARRPSWPRTSLPPRISRTQSEKGARVPPFLCCSHFSSLPFREAVILPARTLRWFVWAHCSNRRKRRGARREEKRLKKAEPYACVLARPARSEFPCPLDFDPSPFHFRASPSNCANTFSISFIRSVIPYVTAGGIVGS